MLRATCRSFSGLDVERVAGSLRRCSPDCAPMWWVHATKGPLLSRARLWEPAHAACRRAEGCSRARWKAPPPVLVCGDQSLAAAASRFFAEIWSPSTLPYSASSCSMLTFISGSISAMAVRNVAQ